MGTSVVITENDRNIARIGVAIQAESYNLPKCDEVKAFLEHIVEYDAGQFAMERHKRNAFHSLTFGNKEFQLEKELEIERKKVEALEKQVKELQSNFSHYSPLMLDVIEMEQIQT